MEDSHQWESSLQAANDDDVSIFSGSNLPVSSELWRTLSDEELNEITNSLASYHISEDNESGNSHQDQVDDTDLNSHHHRETSLSVDQMVSGNATLTTNRGFICDQCMLHKDNMTSVIQNGDSVHTSHAEKAPPVLSDSVKRSTCQIVPGLLNLQVRLLDAINQGDVQTVISVLEKKLNPNFAVNKKNPICRATSLGNIELMKMLLEAGAKPNTPNLSDLLWERHPIHIAASKGHLSAMQLLVKNSADINEPDNDQRTPLHWVAMYGQAHMVKWMLDAGAKVNISQTDGFTPLHTATCLGHREVCRLLIQGGADMFHRDWDGWTPLHTAVCYGYIDIVTLLLEKGACPLVTTGLNGDSTLHLACTKGRLDIVELMLKNNVPIESRNSYGFTPLLTAVFYNRIDVAFHLVKKGADVNAVNYAGTSSIYLSAVRCELELVKLLLLAGCRVPRHLSLPVSQHCQSLAAEMDYQCTIPQRLNDQCVVVIRQSLAPDLQVKAQLLPLPGFVKRNIAMENLSTTVISLKSPPSILTKQYYN